MASITAERNPFSSSTRTASMVVPPGNRPYLSAPTGVLRSPAPFWRSPSPPGGEFIGLSARHSAEDGGIGHRFDKHKDIGRPNRLPHHRMDHRLGNLLPPKQRKIVSTSATSSLLTGALGVTEVIPALTSDGVFGIARMILRSWPRARASCSSVTPAAIGDHQRLFIQAGGDIAQHWSRSPV